MYHRKIFLIPLKSLFLLSFFAPGWAFASTESSWVDKVKVSGDLRYRHENRVVGNVDDAKEFHTIRARLNIKSAINDDIDARFQLAHGGSKATSNNETLSDAAVDDGVVFSKAFFEWRWTQWLNLWAGKMTNPAFRPKSDLLYDADYTPEGLTLNLNLPLGESLSLFSHLSHHWLDERTLSDDGTSTDVTMAGGQVGLASKGSLPFQFALGYYTYLNLKNTQHLSKDSDVTSNNRNTTYEDPIDNTITRYTYDFNLINIGGKLTLPLGGLPLTLNADYVMNSDPEENNVGYLVGFQLGKGKKKGQWAVIYHYKHLERDATLDILTDGDFIGGGVGGRGHKVRLNYILLDKTRISAVYYGDDRNIDSYAANPETFEKWQLEAVVKF